MLTGSLVLALVMIAMTVTTAVWQVVLLWCLAQAAANFQYAANNAIVADQVPPHRRGRVSGLVGLATAVGPIAGVVLANAFPAGGAGQWLIVAVTSLAATLAAVLLFCDPRDTTPKPPLDLRTVVTTFWFNPRRHPALGWAWLVRFLIMCAYAATSYNTFFLMQRLGIAPPTSVRSCSRSDWSASAASPRPVSWRLPFRRRQTAAAVRDLRRRSRRALARADVRS